MTGVSFFVKMYINIGVDDNPSDLKSIGLDCKKSNKLFLKQIHRLKWMTTIGYKWFPLLFKSCFSEQKYISSY